MANLGEYMGWGGYNIATTTNAATDYVIFGNDLYQSDLYRQFGQQQYAMQQLQGVIGTAQLKAAPEPKSPNLAWLDRRVDEMRVKLR